MTVEEIELEAVQVQACPDPEQAREMREALLRSVLEAIELRASGSVRKLAAAGLKAFDVVVPEAKRVEEVEPEPA